MTDRLDTIPVTPPSPIVDFVVYPSDTGPGTTAGPEYIFTVDGNTYSTGFYALPYNHPVTFDTTGLTYAVNGNDPTNPPLGIPSIVEYHWDFGDGFFAYGPVVTHKFRAPNAQTRVTLRVTDSRGKKFFAGKQAILIPAAVTGRSFNESVTAAESFTRHYVGARSVTDAVTGTDVVSYTYLQGLTISSNEIGLS